MSALALQTLRKLAVFLLEFWFIVFPTFDLSYRRGLPYWLLISVSITAMQFYFLRHDRALLARRLKGGARDEQEASQKKILNVAGLVFVLPVTIPGLVYQWFPAPFPLAPMLAGYGIIVAGLAIVFLALRANSFAAATVEIFQDHEVASGGPYARVRHPQYSGLFLILAGTPLALGCLWALASLPLVLAVLVWRLRDEERILRARLPGYEEYCAKVKDRLLPGVY